MVKIAVYFNDFFKESNHYDNSSVSKITVNEQTCYKELYTSLRSKLVSIIDMNNIDIYLFLGSIECVEKDLAITNDNNVK